MQHHVSSQFTLLLKLILPTFWIVFFGVFTLGIYFSKSDFNGMGIQYFRWYFLGAYLVGLLLLYWAVMRLKRVEMDEQHIYVTNYFKTYRYPYEDVEKMKERDWLLFKAVDIYLRKSGSFGKRMTFIASRHRLTKFLESHPEVVQQLMQK